ncbi:hypothetical protein [uncultured Agrobacterium sp.]|uniref:hypothetical protein n=1 Tax=uncultured Agrobacterium sp. TaxID=157277 RepID=UPI0025EAB743|nr:hypothetical protein [uncultured Agrobacterium sp.]
MDIDRATLRQRGQGQVCVQIRFDLPDQSFNNGHGLSRASPGPYRGSEAGALDRI